MSFYEFYSLSADIAGNVGPVAASIYSVLSLIYFAYRYAKGDDIPRFNDTPRITLSNLVAIKYYINPFYFKHPVDIIMTALYIGVGPLIVAVLWPGLIPAAAIFYFIQRTRKINLDKKKMWNELKS